MKKTDIIALLSTTFNITYLFIIAYYFPWALTTIQEYWSQTNISYFLEKCEELTWRFIDPLIIPN